MNEQIVYIIAKNGKLITRAFGRELYAIDDCKKKNLNWKGDKYTYTCVVLADSVSP